jgi:hypothetical protein
MVVAIVGVWEPTHKFKDIVAIQTVRKRTILTVFCHAPPHSRHSPGKTLRENQCQEAD